MNEKKNIVSLIIFVLWAALLTALMIRLPVADMSVGLGATNIDIVISACFCAVGFVSCIAGYFLDSKTLVLISAINSFMQILAIICFCLYVFFFNRTILAFALYLCNPFCAILSTPGIAIITAFLLMSAALPIVFYVLLAKKHKKSGNTFVQDKE